MFQNLKNNFSQENILAKISFLVSFVKHGEPLCTDCGYSGPFQNLSFIIQKPTAKDCPVDEVFTQHSEVEIQFYLFCPWANP